MIKAKVSTDYKDIERIFAGGTIQKEIIKVWSTEANDYVFEAWKVLEMEGPLPLTFNTNGEALIDYRIYGNTVQNGTPTPENPIMPIGCGERTENLFDISSVIYGTWTNYDASAAAYSFGARSISMPSNKITVSFNGAVFPYTCSIVWLNSNDEFIIRNHFTVNYQKISPRTFPPPDNAAKFYIQISNGTDGTKPITKEQIESYKIMLNLDSTALPYEPYGYKLPILSNATVTNIYLGEVQTTRRIKKLVLTGEETSWRQNTSVTAGNSYVNASIFTNYKTSLGIGYCTHYPLAVTSTAAFGVYFGMTINFITDFSEGFDTVEKWKSYLAAQYAAGTPVTVWYVLAEPETGVVNEPLMKIGEYVDTVDSAQANVQIPTIAGTNVIDYDVGKKRFITSDGYELVDKNQNGFLLSGSTDSTLCPEKMYIKYKGR